MVSYFVYYTTRILRNAAMLSACLSVSVYLSGPPHELVRKQLYCWG